MRAGAIVSAIAHAGVLAWVMLGTPKPFDTASGEAVAVDLVSPDEAPPEPDKVAKPDKPEPKPEPEKTPQLVIPPRQTTVTTSALDTSAVPSSPSKSAAAKPAAPRQQSAPAPSPQPAPQPSAAAQQQPAQAPPAAQSARQQSAAAPEQPPPPSPAAAAAPPPTIEGPQSIFAPASIPKLMEIAPAQSAAAVASGGFDAQADTKADLARDDIAAFKAHLRKCLRLPAGVDAERPLKVVVRIFLKRDGGLAADPMLVSAPAAREGPSLVEAATKAVRACQPYALPADKYDEWKMLDLSLSPRDMAGG